MPSQLHWSYDHVGEGKAGMDVERVELQTIGDEWHDNLRAIVSAQELPVGHAAEQDAVERGGQVAALIDLVALCILDGAGRIDPKQVANVKTGRRLRPALQAQEAGNIVALVLGGRGKCEQKKRREKYDGT
jgi:hypothetical protein